MRRLKRGGGWAALKYTWRMAARVGWLRLWRAMTTRNACKTCALGMGGQAGGMRNEMGHWPEVCKKSLQAMVADMQAGLRPEFFARYSIAELQTLTPRELEWCGRLTQPVFAGPGDTHYRVITWEETFDRVARQLRACSPEECFFYASGRSSNEAGFLLQLFARLFGTNYINNCSYYCHQASGVGLSGSVGTSTSTVSLEDVENTELFFLIGGNPASNHPRLMRTLMNIRRRGGHVIAINPVRELGLVNFSVPSDLRSLLFGSRIASLYLQPHIGGDIALLSGLAKCVLDRGAAAHEFIAGATEGFEGFVETLKRLSWSEIERQCGVERAQIEKAADFYVQARSAVFGWTMGITQHEHGVANVQTIANLALLRGMVGRPACGLLPIRGHSNVQGIGSVGVTPNLKQAIFDNLQRYLGVPLPTAPGLDTMGCMHLADQGRVRAAFCLGGNLFGSNPDARFATRALGKIDLVVYLNTTLNTTHAWGRGQETLILPVLARDEEAQPTTQESMFNFIRLSEGGKRRLPGPRSEVDIIATIAGMVLGHAPVNWADLKNHCSIRKMIGAIVPGLAGLGVLDATRAEFHIDGRIVRTPRFPTASGKARFIAHELPVRTLEPNQLRLMTVRSEGQFNTVVYEEEDFYRGQERRDVILMNAHDIARMGLHVNERVSVKSVAGVMRHILVRVFDIREGNALMYFPEANVLVPNTVDPASRTPAFKSVLVTLEPESRTAVENGVAGRHALPVLSARQS
jgi:molybdopterin-dependent oxidoreductase alpha subunit